MGRGDGRITVHDVDAAADSIASSQKQSGQRSKCRAALGSSQSASSNQTARSRTQCSSNSAACTDEQAKGVGNSGLLAVLGDDEQGHKAAVGAICALGSACARHAADQLARTAPYCSDNNRCLLLSGANDRHLQLWDLAAACSPHGQRASSGPAAQAPLARVQHGRKVNAVCVTDRTTIGQSTQVAVADTSRAVTLYRLTS